MSESSARRDRRAAVASALEIARGLARAGMPIFVAQPDASASTGYRLPPGWQHTEPDPAVVDRWRPGMALCAVMGATVDGLDVDPRNGGDVTEGALRAAGLWPRSYGRQRTPSGGWHDLVAPLGVGSRDGVRPGLDLKGGKPDGTGRGFLFIAPTVRVSKVTGEPEPYAWEVEPDLDDAIGDDTGGGFADMVRAARAEQPGPATETRVDPDAGDPFALGHGLDQHTGPVAAGERHSALIQYAGYLRRRGVGLDLAERLILDRLRDCAQPPQAPYPVTEDEALGKVRDVYSRYAAGIPDLAAVAEPDADEAQRPASWAPTDLTAYLDGTHTPQVPTLMLRTDGVALLYAGRVHSFHGESESGKSWLALVAVVEALAAGHRVLVLDFESDAATVVGRLLLLGADPAVIRVQLDYVRPEIAPRAMVAESDAFAALLAQDYAVAVLDGVTEALAVFGRESNSNDDLTAWVRSVPRKIAERTGAAVILVDHVVKDAESRGRFAIGGQAKMAALDGAAYVVEVLQPLGVGLRGSVALRVAKDRPGGVRPHAGTWRRSDRTQEAAVIAIDSTTPGAVTVGVEPPRTDAAGSSGTSAGTGDTFRPTMLMQRVSATVHAAGSLSRTAIEQQVSGKAAYVRKAVEVLLTEGYLTADGPRVNGGRPTIRSARLYTGNDDPVPDLGTGWDGVASEPVSTPSRPCPTPSPALGTGSETGVTTPSRRPPLLGGTGSESPDDPSTLSRTGSVEGASALADINLAAVLGPACPVCRYRVRHAPDCSEAMAS